MNLHELEGMARHLMEQPRIIGRASLVSAAVIVPLIAIEETYHLLFEKRAVSISQGGEICFPGGLFDPALDATTQSTAIREIGEELGIEKEKLTCHFLFGSVIAMRGIIVDCYVATLAIGSTDECTLDTGEVERIFTIPVDEFIAAVPEQYTLCNEISPYKREADGSKTLLFPAEKLGLPEKYWHPWRGREHRVLLYPTAQGPIWGLTAEIVAEFVTQLRLVST